MLRLAGAAAAALLLAGCATQNCDPRADRSIFQVGGCVMGGGYRQRVDVLQAEVDRAEAEQAAAERQLATARGRRDGVAIERAQLNAELANERTRAARMSREIATLRERRGADRERLAALDAQLAELRAAQESLRSATPDEATRRRAEELSAQRRGLERSLAEAGRSVQRE